MASDEPRFGSKQIQIYPCLFIRKYCFLLVYVDDILCYSREKGKIDQMVKKMDEEFEITDEFKVSKYLGVDVSRH